MPVPTIRSREATHKFISRCISTLTKLDPKRKKSQIIAICYSEARKSNRKVKKRPSKPRWNWEEK